MKRGNFIKTLFFAPFVTKLTNKNEPVDIEEVKKHLTMRQPNPELKLWEGSSVTIQGRISGKDLLLVSTNEKRERLG